MVGGNNDSRTRGRWGKNGEGRRVLLMAAGREIQDGDANPREEMKNKRGRGVVLEKRLYWLCDYHPVWRSESAVQRKLRSDVDDLAEQQNRLRHQGWHTGRAMRFGYIYS